MEIGKLIAIEPRAVWPHEALKFTPWLASQLDHLGEAIGDELELLSAETAVGPFSADIVARNQYGETVLIENQLAKSDHTHLGQIMTYLAGLEAKTIIWVSTRFQAEHVSAMRWLNDHTPPEFRFFAIELRVVRIGDSPAAPIFDIVVQPNAFEREIKARKTEALAKSDSRLRDFWTGYLERYPEDTKLGVKAWNVNNQWLPVAGGILVGTWIAKTCGVYVRGQSSVPIAAIAEQLANHRAQLEAMLGVPFTSAREKEWLLVQQGSSVVDPATWPQAIDWLHQRTHATVNALRQTLATVEESSI
ncbi:hypothetical protein ASE63_21080 [Bosea sp. Root381]|uniref:hypothetical protein n=1 Tax=Bosea sp. Root381 TaxID=1736524 RepID=UPI0006FF4641|nr:hypothetical protein [Bosea sp. Root381]KRE09491.1 hypothetical protein ASE63_21080 [Bosea sp. Root381]